MNRIEWIFELFDRASAPARRIASSLAGVSRAARSASAGSVAAQRVLRADTLESARTVLRLSDAINGLGSQRGFSAIRDGAAYSAQSVRQLAGSVANLRNLLIGGLVAGSAGFAGKLIVEQVGAIEQQRIALSTLLKSPIRGEAALEWAIKFADITPFETVDVLNSMRRALVSGFSTTQVETLLTTLGDAAAGTGSKLQDLVLIFGQMRSAGRINAGDIMQLSERGIGAWGYIAQAMGKSVAETRKMAEQGLISSAAGIKAIIEGLKRDFGGLMAVQSRSIFGLVSTLRSRFTSIAFRLDRSRALGPFRAVLQNLVDLTDFSRPPGSRIAAQLESGIGGLFRSIFGPLATATEPRAAADRINAFVAGATVAVERLQRVWPSIRAAISEFVAGVRAGFSVLATVWDAIRPIVTALGQLTGGFAQAGVAAGNTGGFVRLLGTIAALSLAIRALNVATLGGLGALSRLILLAASPIISRVVLLGLPQIGAAVQWVIALGAAATRTAAAFVVASARIAASWLVAMGPVGWVIGGVVAVGAAVAALYARFGKFRDAVNSIWASISATARGAFEAVVGLFTSLPDRIIQAVRGAGPAFMSALRDIIRSAPGGDLLLRGLDAAGSVVRGAAQIGSSVGGALVGATKSALGIRSPSREFAYLGRMSALGLAAGLFAYSPIVERAGLALTQAATPTVGVEANGAILAAAPSPAGRIITINFGDINVRVGTDAQRPDQIAEAVRTAAVEAVLAALERAAIEEGA